MSKWYLLLLPGVQQCEANLANKPFKFPQYIHNLIRAGSGHLPADVSLGSVLLSRSKTELQRGHICHESTPSLLSINSPFNDGDSGRSWTLSCLRSHVRALHTHPYTHKGKAQMRPCVCTHVETHKVFFTVSWPHMLSVLPSSSLESCRHKAEITSPSSNQGERER